MIPNAIPFYHFRRFPNTLVEDFAYAVQRKHADEPWKRNISPQLAATIAGLLIKQSNKAQDELREAISGREPASVIDGIREKIWVVRSNGYIRGYLTAAKGSIAAKYPNSYRRRFSEDRPIYPCSRIELVSEIERRLTEDEKAQPGIVDRIIKIGLSNGKYFKHDPRTKLYWSADAAEEAVQHRLNTRPVAARRSTGRLTPKQRIHWERFDSVPGLKHDFQNPSESELITWVIAESAKRSDTIDAAEAIKRYNAARKCSRVETDIPFKHDKGRVYGRHYYSPGFLRDIPRMLYSQFLTWTKSEEGSAPTVHLQKAISCGDVLRIWIGEDPIEGIPMFAYVGADVHHKLLWQAEKEKREEQERKQREREAKDQKVLEEIQMRDKKRASDQAPFKEELRRTDSKMAKSIRNSGPIGEDIYEFMTEKVIGFWEGKVFKRLSEIGCDAVIGLFYTVTGGVHAIWSEEHEDYVGVDWLEKPKTPAVDATGVFA
jgi:hypothetical protein